MKSDQVAPASPQPAAQTLNRWWCPTCKLKSDTWAGDRTTPEQHAEETGHDVSSLTIRIRR